MSNTITAYFKGRVGVAEAVYQNDYGIVMQFDGIYLPSPFDCYFSKLNQEEAVPGIGTDNRVVIPNSILADPGNMTIHIPLHDGAYDSEVEYVVYFKVVGRARPVDDGTPTQMTAVERALALLSQPITNIEEIVNEALSMTGDTFQEMKEDLQGDYADFTYDVNADVTAFKTEVRGRVSDVEDDFADLAGDFSVLQGQFDTAVAAVTTDTEVTDIRVGDDGVTYTTAGKAVRDQFADVKSAIASRIEYQSVEEMTEDDDVDFSNSTDGMLQSDGSVSGSTAYCVSDFIPLENVKTMFRYGTLTKYNLEAYALYNASKQLISGTYHARSNSYDFVTYHGHSDVVFYDISNVNAKYIRITKDKTLPYYSYTSENIVGRNYTINGDIHADNIDALGKSGKLEAQKFVIFKSNRDSFFDHTLIDQSTGAIVAVPDYPYRTSDYIPISENTKLASGNGYSYACYDENKGLLSFGRLYTSDSSSYGTQKYWFVTTPANCAYIRVCWYEQGFPCGIQKVPTYYDIVDLGDSIFGVNPACMDISSIAQEKSGYTFGNCGFGGSLASSYPDSSSPYYSFNLWKLVDAIVANDYSEQDISAEAIEATDGSILYVPRLTILKSVDFTTVKMITIAYGTNDCSQAKQLDNADNKYDKETFCGALRYSIEKLFTNFPSVKIVLLSAPYGRKGNDNIVSTDTWTNNIGLHLMDYVSAMKGVADEYHIPFFNHYTNMGVNDYNWQQYLRDGTHLSYTYGADLFGAKVGEEVNSLLPEYF